ncbi:MAG: 23S rRNA (guanosine(2251)-2'-O)-methyltransferase RlmB [Phascolarctobacterium sp.]|nr:23S rRNA (guanosine(2251)-2'-O)-methyltransferase RlmB [Phascolarctobacterium sp.]
MSEDFVIGRNPVIEALNGKRVINKILLQDTAKGGSISKIIAAAKERGIIVEYVKKEKLDKLDQKLRHQGVAALVSPVDFQTLDMVFMRAADKNEQPFILLLNGVQDPQNVGALLRSADAAGVHGVLLPKRRSCPLNASVAKSSAGAVEHVPLVHIGNVVNTIEDLKKKGCWIVGADMNGEVFYNVDLTGAVVLVIGAEGKGLGHLVREKCDFVASIPMKGHGVSLNASVAGALLMYEVLRQRKVVGK